MHEAETILKCIAIDDEPFALKLLADDLAKISFLKLAKALPSAKEAMDYLVHHPVDLIFLDIQMPGLTGIQFLKQLKEPPMAIITTAFQQYAIESFELEVIDYLMKPIPFERLQRASQRALEQFNLRHPFTKPRDQFFFVHSEYKEVKINHEDVLYVEGLKDYVKIFLSTQSRPILTRMNLKAMERRLPSEQFFRIHNSYIVSLSKISAVQKSQVFLDKTAIPIGEKYSALFSLRYKGI